MQKIVAVSLNPGKHQDVIDVIDVIKSKQMSVSGVVRQLLREFRDRGYRFPDSDQPVI